MKRFCSVLLILSLLLSLCACNAADPASTSVGTTSLTTTAPETMPSESTLSETTPSESTSAMTGSSINPILYKVTDTQGHTAWLFGSIHIGLESFYPLPDYVTAAYENSDALAVEFDMVTFSSDIKAQTNALLPLIYTDGTTIRDHISEDLYTQAVEALEDCGLYLPALDMYCPSFWASFIQPTMDEDLNISGELGIDMYFLNNAHETGKQIQEVESPEFQYTLLAGFSQELQTVLLESALYSYAHPEETTMELTGLLEAWASGNEEAMLENLDAGSDIHSDADAKLYEEYTDSLITQRNISMADFAETALASGKEVFICVGAAHIIGPNAMADLLTQRGYTVERIDG